MFSTKSGFRLNVTEALECVHITCIVQLDLYVILKLNFLIHLKKKLLVTSENGIIFNSVFKSNILCDCYLSKLSMSQFLQHPELFPRELAQWRIFIFVLFISSRCQNFRTDRCTVCGGRACPLSNVQLWDNERGRG